MTQGASQVWEGLRRGAQDFESARISTTVRRIVGLLIEAGPLRLPLGSRLNILSKATKKETPVELVGFSEAGLLLMPYGSMDGISLGDDVVFITRSQTVQVGNGLLGKVLDGEGRVLSGSPVDCPTTMDLYHEAPIALTRRKIREPFFTGIRAWDSFLALGRGQRMGVFAGTGVGKSVLLGMIAKNSTADVNVISLVGERGNEVNEFLDEVLGKEGMKKSVVVVATSDKTPLMRLRSPFVAMSIAEYFAAQGKNVLFLMDSVTRMAMAGRELGLSVGEPPTAKGYPPSVFATLPKLLERAGSFEQGSITGIISVLLEGDDLQDPIGDAVRGILDGHVVLDRSIAAKGQYPAISIPDSLSRWMKEISKSELQDLAKLGRKVLATYREAETLINVGAYVAGSNPEIDEAIRLIRPLNRFLSQGIKEPSHPAQLLEDLKVALSS